MNKIKVPVITLDGPSGTGKGTLCFLLAKHLQWNMLDSGAIYRVLAFAVRKNKMDFQDIDKIAHLAYSLNFHFESKEERGPKTILDDMDVSLAIRSEQCGQDASQIAMIPEVRNALLARQRQFAKSPGLVTDGRDMGTVVFPEAILKIFLDANEEERANRRYLQLKEQENNVSLAQVVEELFKRDARDTARAAAPLKPATDAICIDTTNLSIMQVFHNVLDLVGERLNKG